MNISRVDYWRRVLAGEDVFSWAIVKRMPEPVRQACNFALDLVLRPKA